MHKRLFLHFLQRKSANLFELLSMGAGLVMSMILCSLQSLGMWQLCQIKSLCKWGGSKWIKLTKLLSDQRKYVKSQARHLCSNSVQFLFGIGCLEWFAWDFLPLVQLLHKLPWTMSLMMHRCLSAINRFMSLFEQVVEDTINIGAETASTLKGQVRGFPCPIEVQATMCTASIHASIQIL
jgi:hypothetical protein